MSVPAPTSSKGSKSKRYFNKSLFDIVNQFSLDEFKEYTNFLEVMTRIMIDSYKVAEPKRLNHLVRLNFKKNIPDENTWMKGGFVSLKLTNEFYESETAARIFSKIYGIRKCHVLLSEIKPLSARVDRVEPIESDFEVFQELSSDDEDIVAKVDLTKEDDEPGNGSMKPPKRLIKYPRKLNFNIGQLGVPSGIANYASTRKFVEQIPTMDVTKGFQDEITVSSTRIESPNDCRAAAGPSSVNQSNTTMPKKLPSIVVLSDVVLVSATESIEIQPQPHPEKVSLRTDRVELSKPKIEPKSKVQQRERPTENVTTSQRTVATEQPLAKESSQRTSRNEAVVKPKPKIGPKSRMNNSAVDSPLISTQELLHDLSNTNPSAIPQHNRSEQSNVGPKSHATPPVNSLVIPSSLQPENLVKELMHTESLTSPQLIHPQEPVQEGRQKVVPKARPIIGPKSRKTIDSRLVVPSLLPPEDLLQELHTTGPSSSLTPVHSQHPAVVSRAKPKIGPKSRMQSSAVDTSLISTQELLQDLSDTNPTLAHPKEPSPTLSQNVNVSVPKRTIGPKSRVNYQESSASHTFIVPNSSKDLLKRQPSTTAKEIARSSVSSYKELTSHHSSLNSHSKVNIPLAGNYLTELNCGSCLAYLSPKKQLHIGSQGEVQIVHIDPSPAEYVDEHPVVQSSTQVNETVESMDPIKQLVEAEIKRAREQLTKYLTETEANARSCKNFWREFVNAEYENDSSAAETQLLNNSNVEDMEIEPQSLAVLNPDQIEEEPQQQEEPQQIEEEPVRREGEQPRIEEEPHQMEEEQHHIQEEPQQIETEEDPHCFLKVQIKMEKSYNDGDGTSDVHNNKMAPSHSFTTFHIRTPDLVDNLEIKLEKSLREGDNSCSSDVEIIELPPNDPIEILMDDTQDILDNLLPDQHSTEEDQSSRLIAITESLVRSSNAKSTQASSSTRFLTGLPNIVATKRAYPPLQIVAESAQKIPPVVLPDHDFSQQPQTPPSEENYVIEDCTVTDSQYQRYELLNNENTLFLSSQLENYAFNAGKPTVPKELTAAPVPNKTPPLAIAPKRPVPNKTPPLAIAPKRPSTPVLNYQPNKRPRCSETIKRDLNWKIMDIRTAIFKPLPNNVFHMELQLRNNYDTFHIEDQQSIKRTLHLSDKEWKNVSSVLTALNGYSYDCSKRPMVSQKFDIMNTVMDCFMRSIPLFVNSNFQFNDFMGHSLQVTEQKPLENRCTASAIDPKILKKMEEFKKNWRKDKDGVE